MFLLIRWVLNVRFPKEAEWEAESGSVGIREVGWGRSSWTVMKPPQRPQSTPGRRSGARMTPQSSSDLEKGGQVVTLLHASWLNVRCSWQGGITLGNGGGGVFR